MVVKIVVTWAMTLTCLVLWLVESARSWLLDPLGCHLNRLFGLCLTMLAGVVPK